MSETLEEAVDQVCGQHSTQFSEDREVIRWRTVCNIQRWCKRRVRRGYYQVKNMILILSWEINMLR